MKDADRLIWVVLLLVVFILLAPMLLMFTVIPAMGPEWMNGGHGMTGWWFGSILILLFLLIAVGLIFYYILIGDETSSDDVAIEELKVAYARGDINDEEYEKRYERLKE